VATVVEWRHMRDAWWR